MVSQRKINKIVNKHSSLFKALEEFEKTGKTIVKTRMNFTIDREVAKKFRDYCKEKNYNMSLKIEDYMKNILKRGLKWKTK